MKQTGQDRSAIKRRIEKSLRLARDGRGNPHVAEAARRSAEKLMKKWGFKESDFNLSEESEFPGKNVEFLWLKSKRVILRWRVLSVAISEYLQVDILSDTYMSGSIRLSFIANPPQHPHAAVVLFRHLDKQAEKVWLDFKVECKERKSKGGVILLAWMIAKGVNKCDQKSFYSGFYQGMQERLRRSKESRLQISEWTKVEEVKRLSAPAVIPFEPPPFNPLALTVVSRSLVVEVDEDNEESTAISKPLEAASNEPEPEPEEEGDGGSFRAGMEAALKIELTPTTKNNGN